MRRTKPRAYRAEVVGSMLRPPELVDARQAMRDGRLEPAAYREIEDRAVDEALRLQEEVGMDVVTDGEMRRDIFFDFFSKGVSGMGFTPGGVVRFHTDDDPEAMAVQVPVSVTEKIEGRRCPALDELAYARQHTDKPIKITLPNAGLMTVFWGEASRDAYPDPLQLVADAGAIVKQWMIELADAGADYIQIDAPDLNDFYCDPAVRDDYAQRGFDVPALIDLLTDMAVELGALELPGVTKGMHLCRGNGTQAWIAEGGYESFSEHVFSRATGWDVFHLEYDDKRSGGFEPLANLPDDTVAALGLVSTKWQKLEAPAALKARIHEAARYHPLERLSLAPQCGFAGAAETADQRLLADTTQGDKLRLVADVARDVWG